MTYSLRDVLDLVLTQTKVAEIETDPKAFFVHVRVPDHVVVQLSEIQKKMVPDPDKRQEIDHVTLVYVKKPFEDHPPERVHAALDALREIGQRTAPIEAKLQGWALFDGAAKDGKQTTALVALVDAPGLEHLHVDMVRALTEHGFNPSKDHAHVSHITLGYLGDAGRPDSMPPVSHATFTIDKAHVAARDIHEIPLTGAEKSLGQKAAEFAMNPRDLRKEPKTAPGKGETSAVVGPAPLQGT